MLEESVYVSLADSINSKSNLLNIEIIPLFEDYDAEINVKILEDIDTINKTLNFSCDNNQKEIRERIDINDKFNKDNERYNAIM